MADFVYRGIPIEQNSTVHHVQPVRSIQAPNGKYYRGVLGVDSRGQAFVYNQYPNTAEPPTPPIPPGMIDATWTQWESQNLDWGQLDLRDATANIYFMIPV